MKSLKGNLIILTYGILSYQFILNNGQSIFVYLAALLIELLVLVVLYTISNHFFQEKVNGTNVLVGAIPLLLFHFVIINLASLEFDYIPKDYYTVSKYKFLTPFVYYKMQILFVAIGVIIGYLTEFWNLKTLQLNLRVVESKVIIQALKIWGLGAFSVIIVLLIPSSFQRIGIAFLPISRIILELFIDRRLKTEKTV